MAALAILTSDQHGRTFDDTVKWSTCLFRKGRGRRQVLVQRSVSPFLHEFRADLIDESGALCRGADTGRVQDDATGTPMQRYRGCGVLCLVVAFVFFGRGGSKWGVEFEKGKAERGAGGGRNHFLKGLCGFTGVVRQRIF